MRNILILVGVVCLIFTFLAACAPTPVTEEDPAIQKTTEEERVFRLEELSYTDVDKLDRDKTIFFLTFGNLEEHGPHLPLGSDYFGAIAMRDGVISELHAAHPDHNFVVFPVIPIGEGGAGGLARQFDHFARPFGKPFPHIGRVPYKLGEARPE